MAKLNLMIVGLALLLLGCAAQNFDTASPEPTYTMNTRLDTIEADPRGEAVLVRDVPDILYSPKYEGLQYLSLSQIAALSGTPISKAQLAQVQADLAALSAAPGTASYVPPPPVFATSFTCEDGNTSVQNAVCENQQLAALDVQMGALYRQHLGTADAFERDQLLAAQRGWLLNLPSSCGVTAVVSPAAISCLTTAYQAQIATLTNWPMTETSPANMQSGAIANYVHYKLLDAKQPELCAAIGSEAAGALSDDGSIDPARLDGAQEIAGSHGPASAVNPQGGTVAVDMYRAGLYGGYQMRARGISLSGATTPLLGPDSVGRYVETLPNGGGRYVSGASQTGDYGSIDVFTLNGTVLALMTDTVGYNSPAPPGEAAVAGVFTISQGAASPACLFETYLMPPPLSMGTFGTQTSLTPFLALVDSIQGVPPDALAGSDRQDTAYLSTATRWTMLNMPRATLAQEKAGNWTGWLRSRHDQVLDALYAWSQKSAQNQAQFTQLFTLLRPAAMDLQTIYVQQQGLTANDAAQATAIAMMELLYQSTVNFAPALGSGPAQAAAFKNYQPRYPILADPQS